MGSSGNRLLFAVKAAIVVDVAAYSAIAAEQERMLLPGLPLEVKAVLDGGGGLTIVQLEQDSHAPTLLPFKLQGSYHGTHDGSGRGNSVSPTKPDQEDAAVPLNSLYASLHAYQQLSVFLLSLSVFYFLFLSLH